MSDFKSGDKVKHALFGRGVVRSVSGAGMDTRITVDFSPGVGSKKLLAGVANLIPGTAQFSPIPDNPDAWFDSFHAACQPRHRERVNAADLHARVRAEVRRPDFWIEVRERLRARGLAPKVLDGPSGRISVSVSGMLTLRIRVRHDCIDDARSAPAGGAIFDALCARLLRDFEGFVMQKECGIEFPLIEEDVVDIEAPDLGELPSRTPLRRPKPVAAKGTIRATPRRRDDY